VGAGIFFHTKPHLIIHNCLTSQYHVIYSHEVTSFNKLINKKYEKYSGLLGCVRTPNYALLILDAWMCDRVRTPNYAHLILVVWMCGHLRTPNYALLILDVWICGHVRTPNYALVVLDVWM
jgi:hypothetical protein